MTKPTVEKSGMPEADCTGRERAGCMCGRKKVRDAEEQKKLINRLNRIEGQIRGIGKMVEEECYCVDILTQVSAVQAALNGFNRVLLSEHIKTCVVDDIRAGNEAVVDELLITLQKIMK